MDNLKHFLVIGEFHARHHKYTTIPGVPVIITDETALGCGALMLTYASHAETDVWWCIERRGIEDGYTVPAGLNLDG